VAGVNRQLKAFSRQLQAASLGVGGSVAEARKVSDEAAHEGYVAADADDWEGVLMKETRPYCVFKLSKSALVVTVLVSCEIVTMPNCPAALAAGKYENAIPPDQTVFISELNRAIDSVQRRGGEETQPNSLK
jgi:ABC-type molybdate transport system substrate-binding protein